MLVRRHGVYVWGKDWVQAKTQAECYDYLFEAALRMHALGIDAARPPAPPPVSNGHAAWGAVASQFAAPQSCNCCVMSERRLLVLQAAPLSRLSLKVSRRWRHVRQEEGQGPAW